MAVLPRLAVVRQSGIARGVFPGQTQPGASAKLARGPADRSLLGGSGTESVSLRPTKSRRQKRDADRFTRRHGIEAEVSRRAARSGLMSGMDALGLSLPACEQAGGEQFAHRESDHA